MESVRQKILVLLYPPVLVPRSLYLFRHAFAVSNLTRVDWIVQDFYNRASGKMADFLIPEFLFGISMLVQIIADGIRSHIRMDKLIKDYPDNLRFLRVHDQGAVFGIQPISKRRLPSVPFPFPGFLSAPFHSLNQDIFPLNLSNSGQNSDGQFPGIFGRINPVFHTNQVYAVILDILQGIQHIRCVSAKPGQLEHQDIAYPVPAIRHVLKHLLELRSSGNAFSGFSRVTVFPDNLHTLKLREFHQTVFLGVQAVAVHLHGSRNPDIKITFFLLFHASASSYSAVSGTIRKFFRASRIASSFSFGHFGTRAFGSSGLL